MSIMVGSKPVKAMKVGELAGELQRYINACNGLDGQTMYPVCRRRAEEIVRELNRKDKLDPRTVRWCLNQGIDIE